MSRAGRATPRAGRGLVVALLTLVACHGPTRSELPNGAPELVRADARLCDRGQVQACTNVALAWLDGSAGAVDEARARSLLEPACAARAGLACDALASIEPEPRATRLLVDACAHSRQSCLRLAEHIAERDPEGAFDALGRACDGRILEGCTRRAVAVRDGIGTEADPERALRLLVEACGLGSMSACREQALLRQRRGEHGSTTGELFLLACRGGDAPACASYADLLHERATPEDRERSQVFRRQACELGLTEACAPPGVGTTGSPSR